MKNSLLLLNLALLLLLSGCVKEKQFITDAVYLQAVEKDFEEKKRVLSQGEFFPDLSRKDISLIENQALKFMYAYMSLGDISDYPSDFYLDNIRCSFNAKKDMPWGEEVPEKIFRHFVLPVRVNNENLDSFRTIYYDELKERVKGLSMYDAVLEINHWCHERVTYTPSDPRTSSPIASIKTAYGRCGEESTFTVSALRTIGVPARQVYTPRWAHTDNNHAWVEAWVDGKWYYLGACEPAPVLNMGWFDEPVKRALLLHTNVFGKYDGPEDIMHKNDLYTEINVTANYAATAKATVIVVDEHGNPIEDAYVEFGIYNYAEFFPVLRTTSDKDGRASITTGRGDVSAWISKNGMNILQVVSANDEDVTVVLKKEDVASSLEVDIVPPVAQSALNPLDDALVKNNECRLAFEDSIRNAYVSTFISDSDALEFSKRFGDDADKVVSILKESRGNWAEIESFLEGVSDDRRHSAVMLLSVIAHKDLRDAPASTLNDHLMNSPNEDGDIFFNYVLNPRVEFEMLTPYRSFFRKNLPDKVKKMASENPALLVDWAKRIKVDNSLNPQRIRMAPKGVYELGVADLLSKNIFFVSLCRSLDVPARIEKVASKLQYYFEGKWHDVDFEGAKIESNSPKGMVKLNYNPTKLLEDPQYDTHFTIQRVKDGKTKRLNFRNSDGMKSSITWKNSFSKPIEVESGDYLLITGTRMASGKVLGQISSFIVEEGKMANVDLTMRKDEQDIQVIGGMDPEALFLEAKSGKEQSILSTTGRGYFIVGILEAGKEPSNHVIRDLARLKADFEKWDREVILLFKDESQLQRFNKNDFPELPSNVTFGVDQSEKITKMLASGLKLPTTDNLPIFVIADTFGRVVFVSQGYQIGLGDRMIQVTRQL